jgi:spore maturation protein SpmB
MNVAANMLGLDNAATPLGLNAMKKMQEINPKPDTATDAQIMLLVLNTSGLTIIPITVIMYRAQMGAANPTDIFIPTLLSTLIATIGGITVTSFFQKQLKIDGVLIAYGAGIAAFIAFVLWYFNGLTPEQAQIQSQLAGNAMLLIAVAGIIFYGLIKKIKAYEVFVDGAKEGFTIAVEIIPYLVAMLIAVGVLRASGVLEGITQGFSYIVSSLGMDTGFVETIPIAIMRPLSGSGARALMLDLLEARGADSFAGKLASVMQGTTDTTLYIVALYFGAVKVTQTRYAIPAGLSADLIGVTAAILLSYMFFD